MRDIGVTTVVDLRSSAELGVRGPGAPGGVWGVWGTLTTPSIPEIGSATDAAAEALLIRSRDDNKGPGSPGDPVCGHYLGYLEDRPDQVVGALRSIAAAQGAALVHCAAGKDRTGVVVALVLTAAGVAPSRPSSPTTPPRGSAPRPS